MIAAVDPAPDQAQRLRSIDEAHHAVMPEQECTGDFADGRSVALAASPDRQQQLMLSRCEPDRGSLLLAPLQEPAQASPEIEESLVIGVGNLWFHQYIVTR